MDPTKAPQSWSGEDDRAAERAPGSVGRCVWRYREARCPEQGDSGATLRRLSVWRLIATKRRVP